MKDGSGQDLRSVTAAKRSRRTRADRPAFTFVEMMVTVTLMAIATAMIVPTLSETDSASVRAAAWLVVGELDFAQTTAITDPSEPVRVTFDAPQGRFWVAKASTPQDPLLAPYTDAPHDLTLGVGAAESAAGVAMRLSNMPGSALEYDAFGRINAARDPIVSLTRGESIMRITVSTDTGFLVVTDE